MFFFHSEFQLKFLSPCFLQKTPVSLETPVSTFQIFLEFNSFTFLHEKILQHQGQRSQILKKNPRPRLFTWLLNLLWANISKKVRWNKNHTKKDTLQVNVYLVGKLQQIAKLQSLNEIWVVLGGGTCDKQYTAIHRIYLQKLSKWIYLPQFGWHWNPPEKSSSQVD